MPSLQYCEKPYSAVVTAAYWDSKACFRCLKTKANFRCTRCQQAWYCSKECQTVDWADGHSKECTVFKHASKYDKVWDFLQRSDSIRLTARVLARKACDGGKSKSDDLKEFPPAVELRKTDDLLARRELAKGATYEAFHKTFGQFSAFFADITQEEFDKVNAAVATNSLKIKEYFVFEVPATIGLGLYLQSSRFNHSCDPDMAYYFDGHTLRMRLKEHCDLSKDFDDLTISYGSFFGPLRTTEQRRKILNGWMFQCKCSLCEDTSKDELKRWSVNIECPNCKESLIVRYKQKEVNRALCLRCEEFQPIAADVFKRAQQFWRHLERNPSLSAEEIYKKAIDVPLNTLQNSTVTEARLELVDEYLASRNPKIFEISWGLLHSYSFFKFQDPHHMVLMASLASLYANSAADESPSVKSGNRLPSGKDVVLSENKKKAAELFKQCHDLWSQFANPQHHCSKTIKNILIQLEE